MRDGHHPEATMTGWIAFDLVSVMLLLAAAVAYGTGLWHSRSRGRWPWHRTASWYLGLVCAGAALVGPLAVASRTGFTEHMAGHLLLGMVGPLLLVLAAPVTLALRTLPATAARRLSRLLRSLPVRVVSHPVTAAALNAGGLWLLYTTDLYHLMHSSVWLHALVHAHVFLSGVVFTAAIVSPDPNPHRASLRMRAVVMVAFIAAHSVLGKWLYAHPPAGVDAADARFGAQLMYYGGDVVDVILLVLLFAGWYPMSRSSRTLLRANPSGIRSRTPSRQETPT
ncbi:cytochrome c oxidase assembly protein [Corynebacterium halotolerans]|uniref:Cytochrome c oxidase assembly protein n=1 Tax=Corynebacterium halotolerans YIM 70093 = DSM 44683 TaxID=1121362 RepID=M1P751_9CORY|nr:cytochrome c oxidase assembly protein [Corynebacterium halotolerans]AGF72461.1 hypothetical protein A605_07295 [Corynebacterium halotolerans YIM 70093 = DSM 44683]